MIYTLTLNPAVDLELTVDEFRFDSVGRALRSQVDCGGKGFNVSRMLANLQTPSVALGFVGGKSGERLQEMLQQLGIETDFNWINGETRTNVSIVKSDSSRYLKVNEPGPTITATDVEALVAKVGRYVKPGDWWVLSGSLPPGVPESIYATLTRVIESAGANAMLDTSGAPLREGLAACPSIAKPNMEEARELTASVCHENASESEIAEALLAMGPTSLVISKGSEGALLVTPEGVEMVRTPAITERNPIGAGDSMVGGIVWGLSRELPLSEALKCGIACGAATASRNGTALGTQEAVEDLLSRF